MTTSRASFWLLALPACAVVLVMGYSMGSIINKATDPNAQLQQQAAENAAAEAAIKEHHAMIGMSREQATRAWGRPCRVNHTIHAGQDSEQWVYGRGNYLYFVNGRLTAIQN